jgi:uncharacterized protein YeaO (DUF488 family)
VVSPSNGLQRWFGHGPLKWKELQKRCRAELASNPNAWKPVLESPKRGDVNLLYSARDIEHNNASVLKSFLEEHIGKR